MTPSTDAEAVLDLIDRWTRTEQSNDPEALNLLLAEGFVGVGPLGFVLSRDQWLHRFAGGLHNRDVAVIEPELHHHATMTVVVGVLAQEASYQGRDSSGRFRVSLTVVGVHDNAVSVMGTAAAKRSRKRIGSPSAARAITVPSSSPRRHPRCSVSAPYT